MPLGPIDARPEKVEGSRSYSLTCRGGCNGSRHIQLNILTGDIVDSPRRVADSNFNKTYEYGIDTTGLPQEVWGGAIAAGHAIIVHNTEGMYNASGNNIAVQV